MRYTLNQLQIFLKVAQTKSVTKAAEELHLTQPAVSIQLKNFQDQFDIRLTEVIRGKFYITNFGKEIAEVAQNVLNHVYAIDHKTQAHKGQLAGRLTISVVSTGKYVMPYFLSDFINLHAGVELGMDVSNKMKVIESLEKNEVDFALVSILPESLEVNKIELMENSLYLVGNKDAKIRKDLAIKELFAGLPLIYREMGSGTRQTMERFFGRHHLKVRKKLELTSNETVKQAVIAGLGFSIMPLIGIKNEILTGAIKVIPVKGLPIKTTWQLIWLKEKSLSPVARSFLNHIEKEKENIRSTHFNNLTRIQR